MEPLFITAILLLAALLTLPMKNVRAIELISVSAAAAVFIAALSIALGASAPSPPDASRFFAIDALGAIIALIGAHLYLVVKLGTTAPPWVRAQRPKSASPVAQLDAGVEGNGRGNGGPAA